MVFGKLNHSILAGLEVMKRFSAQLNHVTNHLYEACSETIETHAC